MNKNITCSTPLCNYQKKIKQGSYILIKTFKMSLSFIITYMHEVVVDARSQSASVYDEFHAEQPKR